MPLTTEWNQVGIVTSPHGIRGEVKLYPSTDFAAERFTNGSKLVLRSPDGTESVPVEVMAARPHKTVYILRFAEFQSINEVERYRKWSLCIPRDELGALPEHEFYFHEIIGCAVETEDGEPLGTVTEILQPGANDVWVVEKPGQKPVYLPYIEQVVREVDPANKRIKVRLMEGLID